MSPASTPSPDGGFLSHGSARIIGEAKGLRSGPVVVATGGLHGNEPAGVSALQRGLERIERECLPIRGRFVALRGNLQALQQGRRFVRRDLNRSWDPQAIGTLAELDCATLQAEDVEQRELLKAFLPHLQEAPEPVVFLDLHSSSGTGPPFSCMADVLRNRPIAFALPIPVVLGLEEVIQASMLGYLCDLGHIGVAVEGGQHDDPATVDHHESALWITLVTAGCLEARDVPDLAMHRRRLARAARGLPSVLEIRHRHVVRDGDDFVMEPGFTNFDPIEGGQVVARDCNGAIEVPEAGRMMLPRYQGQGEDGYFVARAVSRKWLRLSAMLRHVRADHGIPLLPGVHPHPDRPDTYVVDTKVAKVAAVQLFHLLGYRRTRPSAEHLEFSRRRPDHDGREALPPELVALAPV